MKQLFDLKTVPLLLLVFSIFVGCGYKPSAKFARDIVGEKVSTSVIISLQDPQNTVVIKDAVDRAVIEIFQTSLVDKSISDTHLVIKLMPPAYSPIIYDENGFVTGYRMSVTLNITREKKSESKIYNTRGFYDFSVVPNAIVTDQQRFEAIEFAAQRAINAFVAQVSAEGARAKN